MGRHLDFLLGITYGFEKPLALSHAVTSSGFDSKARGTWLPDDRSTRNFLVGGWLLLAVIVINNSLLTSSITVGQKQQNKSNNLSNLVQENISVIPQSHFVYMAVFTHFCLWVYPCWNCRHDSENQEVTSCSLAAHTNTVHEKAPTATIIPETGLFFISFQVIHFYPEAKSKICVWKHFTLDE